MVIGDNGRREVSERRPAGAYLGFPWNCLLEAAQIKRIKVDLYESMVFWFAKEFVKAVLGLGLILGITIFFQWLNSDD